MTYAEGVWVAKEENSTDLDQFRSISLLSTEGKIYFCILSLRLSIFCLRNNSIDTWMLGAHRCSHTAPE